MTQNAADSPEQRAAGALQQQQQQPEKQEETTPSAQRESDLRNHSSADYSESNATRKAKTYAAKRLVLSECNENASA